MAAACFRRKAAAEVAVKHVNTARKTIGQADLISSSRLISAVLWLLLLLLLLGIELRFSGYDEAEKTYRVRKSLMRLVTRNISARL